MSRSTGWNYRCFLVPGVVGAAAVVLIGSQFSGYSLPDQIGRSQKAGARPDHQPVGDDRIVLHSRSVTRYEFGVMDRGGQAEKAFVCHNPGPTAVTVTGVTTSCECLRVELADYVIGPGESVSGMLVVDFRNEPQFAGDLLLRAEGSTDGVPGPAFVIEAGVSVR